MDDNKTNVVSLNWKRKQNAKKDMPLDERVAQLESEMEKVIAILMDTVDLTEKNREYLFVLLRKLKNKN